MQYIQGTEKVAMLNDPYMDIPRPVSLAEDREVQRTRKILIIILGVCLALSAFGLADAIFGSGLSEHMKASQRSTEAGEAIIAIIFYGFGLFVAHRYSTLGLRIFAWLLIIELIALGLGIVLLFGVLIVGIDTVKNTASLRDDQMKNLLVSVTASVFIILIIVCVGVIVLSIVLVKLAFKLARLIEANSRSIIQQA